jgi:hypothetical protein
MMMITQSDARNNHTDEPAASTGQPEEAHTGRLQTSERVGIGRHAGADPRRVYQSSSDVTSSVPPGITHAPPATALAEVAAIFSLVFGMLSIAPLPIIGSIVAIVTGSIARQALGSAPAPGSGAKPALFGIIMGAVTCILWMLAGCVLLAIQVAQHL